MSEVIIEEKRVSRPTGLMGDIQEIREVIGEARQIVAWREPAYTGREDERRGVVVKMMAGRNLPHGFTFHGLGEYLSPGIEIRKQEVDYLHTTPALLFSLIRSGELEGNFQEKLMIPGSQRAIDLEPLKKTITGEGDEATDHQGAAHIINDWLRAEAISATLRISDTLYQEKGDLHLTNEAKGKLKEELELSGEPSEEQIKEAEEQRKKLLAGAIAQIREQDEVRLSLYNLSKEAKSKEDRRLRESLSQEFWAREKEKPGQTAIDWFKQQREKEREIVQAKLKSSGLSLELLRELEGKSMDEVKNKVREATAAYEEEEKGTVSLKDFLDGEEKVTRALNKIIGSLETL